MFSVLRKISAFAGSRRGLLKKSMLVAFLGAVFTAFQFWALMLTLEILVGGANLSIWPVIGIMLVSVAGRTACSYWSTNAETETGYFMVAEKRVHIGDRLRYIPMGYFNDNSLGNITAVVTTTLGDVENNAARCLVSVIGGFLNTLAIIAHRLSTIRNADKIIVVEKGHLIEEGNHDELVATGGRYAQMWNHYTEAIGWKISGKVV